MPRLLPGPIPHDGAETACSGLGFKGGMGPAEGAFGVRVLFYLKGIFCVGCCFFLRGGGVGV